MPFNFIKTYSDLLELVHLRERERHTSLYNIFKRDIEDQVSLKFSGKFIKPIKKEGEDEMKILFTHLTCEDIEEDDGSGRLYKKRYFEIDRSRRLHWLLPHFEEKINDEIIIFSAEERDQKRRVDVIKTYIYNRTHKYIIVLLPQRAPDYYFLLTAYHLNKPEGAKTIERKLKKRLNEVH